MSTPEAKITAASCAGRFTLALNREAEWEGGLRHQAVSTKAVIVCVVATAEGFLRPSHEILLRMEALSGKSGNTGREMREEERKKRREDGEKERRRDGAGGNQRVASVHNCVY